MRVSSYDAGHDGYVDVVTMSQPRLTMQGSMPMLAQNANYSAKLPNKQLVCQVPLTVQFLKVCT